MKRILTGIAAAAILMTSAASLAEDVQQDTAIQPQRQIQQEQMTPPGHTIGTTQGSAISAGIPYYGRSIKRPSNE